jgi:DNA-binding transcriptional LysR family regulator
MSTWLVPRTTLIRIAAESPSTQRKLSYLLCCLSMYDLRRLRAFHAVARSGSFSAAARELGYAQSVVSHHVAALEREFGLTLINRGTRPVSVTDAGKRLLRHTEAALGFIAAAEDELRAVAGLESGSLRIGAFLSAANSFVPAALARFEAVHPEVEVRLEQLEEPEALRRLRSGDLDLAVVYRVRELSENGGDRRDEGFDEVHLADDPYRVALPPDHRLGRRSELRLADLAAERFVVPPAEGALLPYRTMFERLCDDAGFKPDIAHLVNDITVARALVGAGLGVAVLPELALPPPHHDIAVRPVRDIQPFRSLHATWLRGRQVPSAAHMVSYLTDAARTAVLRSLITPNPAMSLTALRGRT